MADARGVLGRCSVSSTWGDLGPRVRSAIMLSAVGIAAIWIGGLVFGLLVSAAVGVVVWEMTRMLAPDADSSLPLGFGILSGLVVLAAGFVGPIYALVMLAATVAGLYTRLPVESEKRRFAIYLGWVLLAGYGLTALRVSGGLWDVVWLVLVVVATDIAGYFAGRILGGPKFWPAVSPKKTWSGTMAGWAAAALVGMILGGPGMALLSALLSFASQMGDAAESALKRHTGIKDSSDLIPGHGGVFDRFDALLGAALVMTLIGFFS